ncbi:MAG: 50S ribosomal protein L10 [Candidatus Aenigmarchaeota archaeon]|nr:50S ribosomal protein L10 [Candidatus Aenigmarchaeota archaeon]
MVSERKKLAVVELKALLGKYSVIGMLDMNKLPGRQLHDIRDSLKGKAVIKMFKKNVIKLAIEQSKINGMDKLEKEIKNQPAFLFSDLNPFELAKIIDSAKSPAPAKPGDIATVDIVVKEGPTNLPPGPAIGELQRIKLPAGVEGDKIVIKKDTVVAKEGEEIGKNVADVLMKLGIEPCEIGLNLIAVCDNGTIYGKDILFVPTEKYENDLIGAYQKAFNLAINMGIPTVETLPILISKGYSEALSLAMEANIMTKETVGNLLAKATAQADALNDKAGNLESVTEEPKAEEPVSEEKPAEGDEVKEEPSSEETQESNTDKKPKQEGEK